MLGRLLRVDCRRATRPIVAVDAEVIENVRHSGFLYWEGPTTRYRFEYEGQKYEADRFFQGRAEIGSTERLTFAQGHPEDARERQLIPRSFLYFLLLALLVYAVSLIMGWV